MAKAKHSPLMQMTGDVELDRKLRKLGDKVARKVLRKALNAASTPVVKAAKAKATVRTGLMKRAVGKVVKVKGKRAGARVGVRDKFVAVDDQGGRYQPSRVAHLVELGHVDEDGKHVPAKPFLRPAADEAGPAATNVLKDKLVEGVVKEAQRG